MLDKIGLSPLQYSAHNLLEAMVGRALFFVISQITIWKKQYLYKLIIEN
jgi:hypothetical protein